MPTWKLTIEYDGTDFCGWQRQPNGPSIQQAVEEALSRLHSGETIAADASGRTDAGVHARGQVVSCKTSRELRINSYERGLNMYLPLSVAVRRVEPAPEGFDARRWARGKRYVYRILRSRFRSPLRDRFTWLAYQKLNIGAMREAAQLLIGRHDFAAFRAANCVARTTVREMRRVDITEEGDELVLAFEASAFLKQMVRTLTGTLWEVGVGKRDPTSIGKLLRSTNRAEAGPTAPPQGLCLEEVFYDLAAGPPRRRATSDADE